MTTTNALMREDLAIAKNNVIQLQEENSVLRNEKEALLEKTKLQMQVIIIAFIIVALSRHILVVKRLLFSCKMAIQFP